MNDAKAEFEAIPVSRWSYVYVSPRRVQMVSIDYPVGFGTNFRVQKLNPIYYLPEDVAKRSMLTLDLKANPFRTFKESEAIKILRILNDNVDQTLL